MESRHLFIGLLHAFAADPAWAENLYEKRGDPEELQTELATRGFGHDDLVGHLQNENVWDSLGRTSHALGIRDPKTEIN